MRIKATALLFSALLPLSVFAATDTATKVENATQQEQRMLDRQQMMQQRQNAMMDTLKLTAEQRSAFEQEMQQHRERQQAARTAHHDKLRGLLNAEQQAEFDKRVNAMQNGMHKRHKMQRSGGYRTDCQDKPSGKRLAQ